MSTVVVECARAHGDAVVSDMSRDGHTIGCIDLKLTCADLGVGVATPSAYHIRVTTQSDDKLPQRDPFATLVADWKAYRGHSSKITELVIHPSYQQIIGMGERAIPLILDELRDRPDHWDWALRAITGIDPVPRQAWGKLKEIAAAWLRWGVERGYIK